MKAPASASDHLHSLAERLGWRSIFWFLCIASAFALVVTYLCVQRFMLLLMLILNSAFPETLRVIVGDGSIPPPRIYATPLSIVKPQWSSPREQRPARKPIQNPFRLLAHPDVLVLLIFNGTFYAVFYGVTATISSLFAVNYPDLSETEIGLVFLSVGGGMVFGSGFTGKLVDRDYRLIKAKMDARAEQDPEKQESDADFPIERARLRSTPIYLAIYVTAIIGYGWSLKSGASIAVPLILHFISAFISRSSSPPLTQEIVGYTIVALMNTAQTLLVDLLPGRGSAVTGAVRRPHLIKIDVLMILLEQLRTLSSWRRHGLSGRLDHIYCRRRYMLHHFIANYQSHAPFLEQDGPT
jgi:hypothetical protein